MSDEDSSPTAKRRKILVIEDDQSISLGLRLNLEAEGYDVEVVDDGETGLERARAERADLVILDVMLPRMNGLEVLRALRHEHYSGSIIMLSARGAEMDKVVGLELGAEDYITKPFGLAELLARVKAVLRRDARNRTSLEAASHGTGTSSGPQPTPQRPIVKCGDLEIRYAERQVLRKGEVVNLTATEFDVLWCLVQAEGGVLSREDIRAYVWGPAHHGTVRTIDNFLLQLRNKLEDDPQEPRHLLTVRGVGYRFHAAES